MIVNCEDDGEGRGGVMGIGWHTVKVASVKDVKANSGNVGVEVTLVGADGSIKRTFWVTPAAKYMLGEFAVCCGYTGQLRSLDTNSIVDAEVQVEVAKGKPNDRGKCYNEVVGYMPLNASSDDDDIPF